MSEDTKKENQLEEKLSADESSIDEIHSEDTNIEEPLETTEEQLDSIKLSGLMGTKLGMTQSIMEDGRVIPLSLIHI